MAAAGERKTQLRKALLEQRQRMDSNTVREKSRVIIDRLLHTGEYLRAQTVMAFVSMRNEVRTERVIRLALEEKEKVIVPVTELENGRLLPSQLRDYDCELAPGTYGVMEPKPEYIRPVPEAEIDLVLTPGAVFDTCGNRIGYGGGFYDRFLPQTRPDAPALALAFDFQVLDCIQHAITSSDVRVDAILTEEKRVDCKDGRN